MTDYDDIDLKAIDLDRLNVHAEYHNMCDFVEAFGTVGHTQILGDLILRAEGLRENEKKTAIRILADLQSVAVNAREQGGCSCKFKE